MGAVAAQATHQAAPPVTIASPDSVEEREADRIAESVLRGSAPGAMSAGEPSAPVVYRQCAACAVGGTPCASCAEDEEEVLHRKEEGVGASSAGGGSFAAQTVAQSGGSPLSDTLRSYFEPRFGADLSDVRVHTDARAGLAAKAIGARAYAYGSDIAFAPGAFDARTDRGCKLIAHELAHVTAANAFRPFQVKRDLMDEAQRRSLHQSELDQLHTPELETLLNDLRDLSMLFLDGSPDHDGLVNNIAIVESVLRARFASETSPPADLSPQPSASTQPAPSQPQALPATAPQTSTELPFVGLFAPEAEPGTGGYAASLGMSAQSAVEATHWGSDQERADFIYEYAEYARKAGLTNLYNQVFQDYPVEAAGFGALPATNIAPAPLGTPTPAPMPQVQPLAAAPPDGRRVVRRVQIFVPEVSGPGGILPTRAFSNAYPVGENYMIQDEPDPSAGWNFDTFIDGPNGRIAAQHMGGTRYRVFMGSPECPGCHFGRGLEVDFQGQSFLAVLMPNMVSGLSSVSAMRGSSAMTSPRTPTRSLPSSQVVRPIQPANTAPPVAGGGQVIPIRPGVGTGQAPPAAFSGSNALKLQPQIAPVTQPQQIVLPNLAPANSNAFMPFIQPPPSSALPLTTTLLNSANMAQGVGQSTAVSPAAAPGQGPQTGDRDTPCDYPLPLAWPSELPSVPWATLVRGSNNQRSEQGRMNREIRDARGVAPPPNPCDDDVLHDSGRWNDPFDAHHIHPLFLGGGDTRANLCSLNAAFHQNGHPRLASQTEYLDVYRQCGINSGNLNNHPHGQVYFIDKTK